MPVSDDNQRLGLIDFSPGEAQQVVDGLAGLRRSLEDELRVALHGLEPVRQIGGVVRHVGGGRQAEFRTHEAAAKFCDEFAHRITFVLSIPSEPMIGLGPVNKFVTERFVKLGSTERFSWRHSDAVAGRIVEGSIAAIADVGTDGVDRQIGFFEHFTAAVDGVLPDSQVVEVPFDLLDVEDRVRLHHEEAFVEHFAGVCDVLLLDRRPEDHGRAPVARLDVGGTLQHLTAKCRPLLIGRPVFALETVLHRGGFEEQHVDPTVPLLADDVGGHPGVRIASPGLSPRRQAAGFKCLDDAGRDLLT